MITLHVGINKDFLTITEALAAIPYEEKATIYIAEGIYEEKVFCEKKNVSLIGAGTDKTIIRWQDYANKIHADGKKYGTFRSYTAFFGGKNVTVKNLSIINASTNNQICGQAIAAYVDASVAHFTNVVFDSYQDTLFCGPLPEKEREIGGFFGPRSFSSRTSSFQFYHQCKISGNIDFIFGGADALFHECDIYSKSVTPEEDVVGYISAPSGTSDGAGFVFTKCQFLATTVKEQRVYLARPWRETGKAAFLHCYLGNHIHERGFSPWNMTDDFSTNAKSTFIEHESYGPGAKPMLKRVSWVKMLDEEGQLALNGKIAHAAQVWGVDSE